MSLREIFSNSIDLTVINRYSKDGAFQILAVFGHTYMLLVEGASQTGLFRQLFNHVFQGP